MAIQNKNIIKISDEYGVGADECSMVSGEQIECVSQRVSKNKEDSKKSKSKSSRCKDTIDWVELEYDDTYEKAKESSTLVKQLTKSEIESLRQNKRDAYELMKYIEDTNENGLKNIVDD